VKGNDYQSSTRLYNQGRRFQKPLKLGEFLIHLDPQRLKYYRCRMALTALLPNNSRDTVP
jgi:hypothetical protein